MAVGLLVASIAALGALGPASAQTEPASPSTTTTTSPPVSGPQEPIDLPEDRDRGFWDFRGRATDAINGWFSELVEDALDPVFRLLGRTVLSTPELTDSRTVTGLWRISWGIANAVFVLFVVAGGAVAMSHETLQTSYTVKEVAPRLVVGWITANASLVLAGVGITAANALSQEFTARSPEVDQLDVLLNVFIHVGSLGVFGALVTLVVVVEAMCVLATYVVRVATMIVLVAAAPLFLIAHALPQTEGMARLWWRAMAGCLAVQVGQALVFVTAVQVYFDANGIRAFLPGGSLMDLLVVGALLWLMLKLPSYARHMVFSNSRTSFPAQAAKHYVFREGVKATKTATKAAVAAL
jgi:hypothetical protein